MISVLKNEKRDLRGRLEDARFLTGKGRFIGDLKIKGECFMGIVRSPYPHAYIKKIDFSEAKKSPYFLASLVGEDLLKENISPITQNPFPVQRRAPRYQLAVEKVRFMGEPVAAVLVSDKHYIEDIVDLIEVEYEPIPSIQSAEASASSDIRIYKEWNNNLSLESKLEQGDFYAVETASKTRITARLEIARQAAVPIEPRSVITNFDAESGIYTVYVTSQSVHDTKNQISKELGVRPSKVHVITMDVGGGFGSKSGQSYPEPLLACLFSKRTGHTVKWSATRTEEFYESATGRDMVCDVTMTCDEGGKISGLKADVLYNSGVTGTQAHMPSMSLSVMLHSYIIPNYQLTVKAYATNRMPMGPMRGAGIPEGYYIIERAMDLMAQKIGITPLEFRRNNLKSAPIKGNLKKVDGNLSLVDTMIKSQSYLGLKVWYEDRLRNFKNHRSRMVPGIGYSFRGSTEPIIEDLGDNTDKNFPTNLENDNATSLQKSGNPRDSSEEERLDFLSEYARITVTPDGKVLVYTGSSPHGQGEETTFAQLTSEELSVPLESVRVIWGDTVSVPKGVGTFGSRSGATGGSAVVDAARKVRSKLISLVSAKTGNEETKITIKDGAFILENDEMPLTYISDTGSFSGGDEVTVETVYRLKEMSHSSGIHVCALEVDADLGSVQVAKYLVVEDCGKIINRQIVEGQIHGGVVHGIGGALLERFYYDEAGNLMNPNMMDYCIPTAVEIPDIEFQPIENRSNISLDGVKGVGESGTNGAYAAVINAVNNALHNINPEIQVNFAPATPDVIFSALKRKGDQ